jgi:serine/threonine protein phosphatase 1
MKKSVIRSLLTNCHGKDYVVGDLHGCYDLLQRVLDEVSFNKTHDRLFSVGDLIDRGPDSLACLQLLAEPWFFAVKGNHEDLMLEFFQSYRRDGHLEDLKDVRGTRFLWYGGSWVEHYFQADKRCMTSAFDRGLALAEDLPLILVIGEGKNRFHIVHSDLIRRGSKTAETAVWLDSDIDRWLAEDAIPASVEDSLLYSRSLMSSRYVGQSGARFQPGFSQVCHRPFAGILTHRDLGRRYLIYAWIPGLLYR